MSTQVTKLFVHLAGNTQTLGEQQRRNLIEELFTPYGELHSFYMPKDHETGNLRNFCFVEMDPEAAQQVIAELDKTTTEEGVELSINVAKPKPQNGEGRGGFRGRPRFSNQNRDNY